MGVSTAFYLHGLSLPGGVFFSELTDLTPTINHDRLIGMASGHPEPLFAGLNSQAFDISFSTPAVKKFLDPIIASGNTPYGVGVSGNIDLYYIASQDLDARQAGASAVHYRFRATKGLLWWKTIRGSQGQSASIEGTLTLLWDGTNPPLVPAGSVVLAGTPVASQFYTMGPVGLSNVSIGGLQDWSLASGCNVAPLIGDGDFWGGYCGIRSAAPVLTGRCIGNPGKDIAILGAALTDLDMYLLAKVANAGTLAKGTAGHICLHAGAGHLTFDSIRSGVNEPSSTSFQATIVATNSSTAALSMDTAIACGI